MHRDKNSSVDLSLKRGGGGADCTLGNCSIYFC